MTRTHSIVSYGRLALRGLQFMSCVIAASFVVACHPEPSHLFLRQVIDSAPPGGLDCCTDVLALGDINGDGFDDVVVGGQDAFAAGLVWYSYPTWERNEIAHGNFTTDGVVVDFDGDGDADIVIGDIDSGPTLFEQTADGRWERHLLGTGYLHDLRVADLDGDGDNDIVLTDKKKVDLLVNDGHGGFERRTLLERRGEGLAVADVDADGDLDILFSNLWLENRDGDWVEHPLAPDWSPDTRIQTADMNGDGKLDVILSASEGEGGLAWFERGETGRPWTEHRIGSDTLTGVHSLHVADFDGDGDMDVLVAEMHTSPKKRILLYRNDHGSWRSELVSRGGAHNIAAADIDRDGDIDFIGKNYGGVGRVVEYWENLSSDAAHRPSVTGVPSQWTYIPIDTARPSYDARKFGSLAADLDGDGDIDVVAGGTLYVNSGSGLGGSWARVPLLPEGDVIYAVAKVTNSWRNLIAVGERTLFRIVAADPRGQKWEARKIAALPAGRTQGWTSGGMLADGSEQMYFTHGTTLYRVVIPQDDSAEWRLTTVAEHVQEESVVAVDLDRDGDSDLVLIDGDGKRFLWLENEGDRYIPHRFGATVRYLDRLKVADINGDGRLDIVYTEEDQDDEYDARVAWLEAPADPRAPYWPSHTITVLRSANSLDVADVDHDGDVDVVVAEHTDPYATSVVTDNFTGVFLNDGDGSSWQLDPIEVGTHSSHLGATAVDLDGDGTIEVVSIAYRQSCCVHAWRRNSPFVSASATKP